MTNSLHLDAFCQFWEMNFNTPVPPIPQKPTDLNITQVEQLRMYDGGKLYQNLFRVTDPKKLPANLARDLSKGLIDHKNKDLYKEYGYEFQFQEIAKAEKEYEEQKLAKEVAAMEERNAAAQKKAEAWSNMSLLERMAAEPMSQDQILQNRKRYGID
tara:strand:- start:32 stop:502 length:471 start_codon:yes stop_codon:yes gene_type:complete